jgi:Cysteine sulfinate desulfinase/cysteine desulfurase and related enzymes
MIYLDYSATTMVDSEVLDTFNKVTNKFIGNPNSLHKLGVESKELINTCTKQIASLLSCKPGEIIYTSGATESNNLSLIGTCLNHKKRGNHIITTKLEHSSIYGPLTYLMENGFEVDFVEIDDNGLIDIDSLKSLIKETTILVSISAVNSELGLRQNVEEIGKILCDYKNCYFHVDATQCIGKDKLDIKNIDLLSFAAHKFYGIKGIGVLIKKEKVNIKPIIHGGKSTTAYRSGTPATGLIASLAKALRLALQNNLTKYNYIKEINDEIINNLNELDNVSINHNEYCVPHILNISVLGLKPETFQHALEEKDIYISTGSACATGDSSGAVYAFTKDEAKSSSSIRISLSHLTTKEETRIFIKEFKNCLDNLNLK